MLTLQSPVRSVSSVTECNAVFLCNMTRDVAAVLQDPKGVPAHKDMETESQRSFVRSASSQSPETIPDTRQP